MAKKIIKTETFSDIQEVCQGIGDNLATSFYATNNIKAALAASNLYRTAIGAGKALLLSQKQTGKPSGDLYGFL